MKLMTYHATPGTLLHEGEPLPPFNRLVVLLPPADLDEVRLARRLRSMIVPYKTGILLLSLVIRDGEDSQERRRLTNLAAILRDPLYPVTSKTIIGNGWIEKIKENLLPGDILVCFLQQKAPTWGMKSQPISQVLAGELPCPVYVLHSFGIKQTPHQAFSRLFSGWVVPITMITLFLAFDFYLAQDAGGWLRITLLGTAMLVEAGLIWSWNILWN
jgi:hypothetical protein